MKNSKQIAEAVLKERDKAQEKNKAREIANKREQLQREQGCRIGNKAF